MKILEYVFYKAPSSSNNTQICQLQSTINQKVNSYPEYCQVRIVYIADRFKSLTLKVITFYCIFEQIDGRQLYTFFSVKWNISNITILYLTYPTKNGICCRTFLSQAPFIFRRINYQLFSCSIFHFFHKQWSRSRRIFCTIAIGTINFG